MSAQYDTVNKTIAMNNIIDSVVFSQNVEILEGVLYVSINPSFIARNLEECRLESLLDFDKIVVSFPKDFTMLPTYKTQRILDGYEVK